MITISNEYGSGAVAIARQAARILGYEFVDRQLPVVEDTSPTLGERLLAGLELATPELTESSTRAPFDDALLRAVEDAVRDYAAKGNAVIVGRGAGAILGPARDALRVFIHAPRVWRVEHAMAATRADRRSAEAEVDRVDRARAEYLRERYAQVFGDPHNYDLCIDASRFEPAPSAALVVAAARARGA